MYQFILIGIQFLIIVDFKSVDTYSGIQRIMKSYQTEVIKRITSHNIYRNKDNRLRDARDASKLSATFRPIFVNNHTYYQTKCSSFTSAANTIIQAMASKLIKIT